MRFGPAPIRLIVLIKLIKMYRKIGFEMSLIVFEAIRGRCASFMVLTATVSKIFGGETNSSILVFGSRPSIDGYLSEKVSL